MFRAGKTFISSGATSVSVPFGASFSTVPNTIIGTVSNVSGTTGNYFLLFPTVIAAGTTSCRFELNVPVDSANYAVSWFATDDGVYYSGDVTVFRAGKTAISNGATSVSVPFGATFSAAPNTVIGTVSNTSGTTGNYLLLYPTVTSVGTTSCRFELNGITDSANYAVSWFATDVPAAALIPGPTGSTGATGATGATGPAGPAAVPAKPINRVCPSVNVAGNDYVVLQSSSGGVPITVRVSLSTLKTFINA
jgi:hypothetical protein